MAFESKEDALNNLFDHIFDGVDDSEITDEDQEWFNVKVAKWFDQFDEQPGPRRKRPGDSNSNNGGSRRRSSNNSNTGTSSNKPSSAYGSGLFFGK